MQLVATLVGNQIFNPQGERVSPEVREVVGEIVRVETVTTPIDLTSVDAIVEMLVAIVAATKVMAPDEQRRIRNFIATVQALMLGSGAYLNDSDQQFLQDKLRAAVRGQRI